MTVRVHCRRDDGFGEYRHYYHVATIHDHGGAWRLVTMETPERTISIVKSSIVGLPEIVE